MPAGGERPGPQARLSATSQEGMKPYSPWPRRQRRARLFWKGPHRRSGCCSALPGRGDAGRAGLGVLAACRAVTQWPQGEALASKGPRPQALGAGGPRAAPG